MRVKVGGWRTQDELHYFIDRIFYLHGKNAAFMANLNLYFNMVDEKGVPLCVRGKDDKPLDYMEFETQRRMVDDTPVEAIQRSDKLGNGPAMVPRLRGINGGKVRRNAN